MEKTTPTLEQVTDVICEYFNVSKEAIFIKSRKKELVYVRQILSYFCYHHCGKTYEEVGVFMGKNHATVVYSVRMINDLIDVYLDKREEVQKIKALILDLKINEEIPIIGDSKLCVPNEVNLLKMSKYYTNSFI